MSDDEDIRRGDRAQALLESDTFAETWREIENDCMARWRTSPTRDAEGRERIWMMVGVLGAIRSELEGRVATGRAARVKAQGTQARREAEIRAREETAVALGIASKYFQE